MDYKYRIEDLEADVKDLHAHKAGYGHLILVLILVAVGFGTVIKQFKELESRIPAVKTPVDPDAQ